MHARRELLAVCLLSLVPVILTQGYGRDPTGGEYCRAVGCGTNAYCTNDYNNRVSVCRCNVGFEVSAANRSNCIDIYECSHREVCENGECINTIGGFYCRCFPGYISAADHTFCLLQDWAPQTDPWSDFWGFPGTGNTKQSEPAFDYNNPWGYSGPLSPNYVDTSYRPQSYYKDQGRKYTHRPSGPLTATTRNTFRASRGNSFQQGRPSDPTPRYVPRDQSFRGPVTRGNANIRGSSMSHKQDLWVAPGSANSVRSPVMGPQRVDSAMSGSSWNTPAKSQGPAQSENMLPFLNDPTLSTGVSGGGQVGNYLDPAASKQWANDPWNTHNMPADPLNQTPMVDISQVLHTEETITRQMGVNKNPLNTNSITSGAAAVPQSSSYHGNPNALSYQKNAQWLNFGQPVADPVTTDPAVRKTWQAPSATSHKYSTHTGVSEATDPAVRKTWQAPSGTSHKYSTHTGVSEATDPAVRKTWQAPSGTSHKYSTHTGVSEPTHTGSKNSNIMPPPDNLSGHSLLLYLILQNLYQA